MLTVGLLGATGFIGHTFTTALRNAAKQGKLNFVILHRPSSDLSKYPKDVDKRVIDIDNGTVDQARQALKGLNVVVSSVSGRSLESQYLILDALAGMKDDLITFFPSDWATPFRADDLESPALSRTKVKAQIVAKAKELGVPVTPVHTATFPELLFDERYKSFSSFKLHENRMILYEPQGKGQRGLTSHEFSGDSLVHLILDRTKDLPNKEFSIVELEYSSADLIDLFTKVHDGTKPKIEPYTEEEYQRDRQAPNGLFDAMRAASRKGLAVGCDWPGEILSDFPGWKKATLEGVARRYL